MAGAKRMVMGSDAEEFVRNATIPLMLVRSPGTRRASRQAAVGLSPQVSRGERARPAARSGPRAGVALKATAG